jgi:hypothetical protein
MVLILAVFTFAYKSDVSLTFHTSEYFGTKLFLQWATIKPVRTLHCLHAK